MCLVGAALLIGLVAAIAIVRLMDYIDDRRYAGGHFTTQHMARALTASTQRITKGPAERRQ